jgi:hypothetical protein
MVKYRTWEAGTVTVPAIVDSMASQEDSIGVDDLAAMYGRTCR